MPIAEVLRAFRATPGGPEVQEILNALAVRKHEALPLIKERLLTGEWYERHLLTKLLRYSPWPETFEELLQLAQNTEPEHYLGQQGALYALGALGNPAAGSVVAAILRDPTERPDTRLVAIATLGRLGYVEAADELRPLMEHDAPLVRIFAHHALSMLGKPVDAAFLLAATNDGDYVIRDEATIALAHLPGDEIDMRLRELAQSDPNRAVRGSATLALLQRELPGRTHSDRLILLEAALGTADRHTAAGILSLLWGECGAVGRAHLETLARQDDLVGERTATFLIRNTAADF